RSRRGIRVRRGFCRFYENGSPPRRRDRESYGAGIQDLEVPAAECGASNLPRRITERRMGISELSFHADGGQPHLKAPAEIGEGSGKSSAFSHCPRHGIQVRAMI